jgi:glycosyltransferase involved in cell wall biosynthesis
VDANYQKHLEGTKMDVTTLADLDVRVVGHIFIKLGIAENCRAAIKAFEQAKLSVMARDIYSISQEDDLLAGQFTSRTTDALSQQFNFFCINADEVEKALRHLGSAYASNAYNVIYPAWELESFPSAYIKQLEKFDEVWCFSRFIYDALNGNIDRPVLHMPTSCEPLLSSFLPRRHFGIPESSFVFLTFFDFLSFVERKNPFATIEAFVSVCQQNRTADLRLVVKTNNSWKAQKDFQTFTDRVKNVSDKIIVLNSALTDNEMKNLVRSCDCFVSLHRSEGFGRGLAEAMYFEKPVIATNYSGNLDFMTPEDSFLVDYKLVPVEEGAYPFWQGNRWAEPSIPHASNLMLRLINDRDLCQSTGELASRRIRTHFSHLAAGLRYKRRILELMQNGSLNSNSLQFQSG